MRVLFFLTNISCRGGTERTCLSVCNELAKNGYEVHIFSISGHASSPAYPINKCINLHVIGVDYKGFKLLMYLPILILKLKSYVKIHNIERLVSVEIMSCLFTLPLVLFTFQSKRKLKFIVWEHFNYTVDLGLKMRKYFRRIAANKADAIVTLTLKDKEMWEANLNPRARLIAIYNPSPFSICTNIYASNSRTIISIGRLTRQKGFDILLESWKLVQQKISLLNNKWNLCIIGDGEEKIKLENSINFLEISSTVKLLPNTDNIDFFYKQASFLCMSSRYEGLPMVLIEAQSYGLPIIAFDCLTGPAEIITKESGILCSAFNKEEFANSILEMAANLEMRIRMSENAKMLASRFAPDKVFELWKNMLESL